MSATNPWFQTPSPLRAPAARLFCFAHAGGTAAAYRLWPALLPAGVEMSAIQLPARANRLREPAVSSISVLADALLAELTPRLDVPFVFFGHSMGAVLSFEVARRLAKTGGPAPRHLVVSGRRPPRVPSREPDIRHLPDTEFVQELNRRYGGVPDELMKYPDVMELLLPGVRADIASLETHTYQPGPPLDLPISAFGGEADHRTPQSDLEAWAAETDGPFRLRMFPGDHFYLDPQRAAVVGEVSEILLRQAMPTKIGAVS